MGRILSCEGMPRGGFAACVATRCRDQMETRSAEGSGALPLEDTILPEDSVALEVLLQRACSGGMWRGCNDPGVFSTPAV